MHGRLTSIHSRRYLPPAVAPHGAIGDTVPLEGSVSATATITYDGTAIVAAVAPAATSLAQGVRQGGSVGRGRRRGVRHGVARVVHAVGRERGVLSNLDRKLMCF